MKIGDNVVRINKSTKPIVWKIIGESNIFKDSFVCDNENELLHHFHKDEIRCLTDEELVQNKRLN